VYGAQKGLSFSGSFVKFTVTQLYSPYAKSGGEEKSSFHFNREWFEKFEKKISLYNVKRIGESISSSDYDGAGAQ
jgi:hypothetical protein